MADPRASGGLLFRESGCSFKRKATNGRWNTGVRVECKYHGLILHVSMANKMIRGEMSPVLDFRSCSLDDTAHTCSHDVHVSTVFACYFYFYFFVMVVMVVVVVVVVLLLLCCLELCCVVSCRRVVMVVVVAAVAVAVVVVLPP